MVSLIAAAVFFDGIHFFISGTALRGKIVGIIREGTFKCTLPKQSRPSGTSCPLTRLFIESFPGAVFTKILLTVP